MKASSTALTSAASLSLCARSRRDRWPSALCSASRSDDRRWSREDCSDDWRHSRCTASFLRQLCPRWDDGSASDVAGPSAVDNVEGPSAPIGLASSGSVNSGDVQAKQMSIEQSMQYRVSG